MTALNSVLSHWVRMLARRELKPLIAQAKRRTTEHRRIIAALKHDLADVRREVQELRRDLPVEPKAPVRVMAKARLRVDGLKAHRAKLGLSAKDYGKLLGVSALTVYNWEAGKSKPRRSLLPRIVAVRGIGKGRAIQWLTQFAES